MQDPVASTPGASASDGEEGLCLDFMEVSNLFALFSLDLADHTSW